MITGISVSFVCIIFILSSVPIQVYYAVEKMDINYVNKSAELLCMHSRDPPTIVFKNTVEHTVLANTLTASEKY